MWTLQACLSHLVRISPHCAGGNRLPPSRSVHALGVHRSTGPSAGDRMLGEESWYPAILRSGPPVRTCQSRLCATAWWPLRDDVVEPDEAPPRPVLALRQAALLDGAVLKRLLGIGHGGQRVASFLVGTSRMITWWTSCRDATPFTSGNSFTTVEDAAVQRLVGKVLSSRSRCEFAKARYRRPYGAGLAGR